MSAVEPISTRTHTERCESGVLSSRNITGSALRTAHSRSVRRVVFRCGGRLWLICASVKQNDRSSANLARCTESFICHDTIDSFMGKIYTKTIDGKKYRYKRVEGKEKYLGPIIPVQRGKIEQASPEAQQRLKKMYEGFATLPEMVRWFAEDTGITVSGRTITNYMSRHKVKRGFNAEFDMSDLQKRIHAQKRAAKTAAEKKAVEHLKILIDDGKIKSAEIVKLSTGLDTAAIEKTWKKYTRKKKA